MSLNVDICCGLNWGDEAKGKIVAQLSKSGNYNFVCRWAGGNNAGHTVYLNKKKFKTHLIPCGIFYNIPSIIGPDCVINKDSFFEEITYLKNCGFNTDLIKISPKAHIVDKSHIFEDKEKYKEQGTTGKGIAPCYRDKYARTGKRVIEDNELYSYLWDEKLYGNVLCEGAQGVWLDINHGNYPYVTSSTTLPYGACSLGFPPIYIQKIYGATKIYDTRSGTDPDFPESLLQDCELKRVADVGKEYGTTTGRRRKVNWLNLDKLIEAITLSGTNILIVSKIDVLKEVNIFKLIYNDKLQVYNNLNHMLKDIENKIIYHCKLVSCILFSDDPEEVKGLT